MPLEIDLVVFNFVLYEYGDATTRSDWVYPVPTIAGRYSFLIGWFLEDIVRWVVS